MQHNNWTKIVILSSTVNVWIEASSGLSDQLEADGMEVLKPATFEPNNFKDAPLSEIRRSGFRIILLLASESDAQKISIHTHRLLMTSGWAWLLTEERASVPDMAGWLFFRPFIVSDMQAFAKQVSEYSKLHFNVASSTDSVNLISSAALYTGSQFNISLSPDSVDLASSAALYDAIMLYAHAATTVMSKGGDLRDGQAVTVAIRNTSFTGVGGTVVSLDSNGDRMESYEVMNYVLEGDRMNSVAVCIFDSMQGQYKAYERAVVWPGKKNTVQVPADYILVDAGSGESVIRWMQDHKKTVGASVAAVLLFLALACAFGYIYYLNRRTHKRKWRAQYRRAKFAEIVRIRSDQSSIRNQIGRHIRLRPSMMQTSHIQELGKADQVHMHGYVALYCACSCPDLATDSILDDLLSEFPHGVHSKDNKGNLPLHILVQELHPWPASDVLKPVLRVAQRLLLAYPGAALEADCSQKLPIQVVCESLTDSEADMSEAALELILALGLPVNCDNGCDNWFYILEHDDPTQYARNSMAQGRAILRRQSGSRSSGRRIDWCLLVEEMLDRAETSGVSADKMAMTRDARGREALHVATEPNRRVLEDRILFLKRYPAWPMAWLMTWLMALSMAHGLRRTGTGSMI